MINLDIPSRWLLTERAIRSCVVCQTPLTYSMLNDPNVLNKMTPLSVSTTWNCFSCGNL